MATGIVQVAKTFAVEEDFDEVMEKFWPSTGMPSSALQGRSMNTYTQTDGRGRVLINPQTVTAIIENYEEEEN